MTACEDDTFASTLANNKVNKQINITNKYVRASPNRRWVFQAKKFRLSSRHSTSRTFFFVLQNLFSWENVTSSWRLSDKIMCLGYLAVHFITFTNTLKVNSLLLLNLTNGIMYSDLSLRRISVFIEAIQSRLT